MRATIRNSLLALCVIGVAGCTTFAESTNTLTDDRIKSELSGVLGYSPNELTITNKRTQGTNTYINVEVAGKEYNCMINGGNFMTLGMTNPPACAPKGSRLKPVFQGNGFSHHAKPA